MTKNKIEIVKSIVQNAKKDNMSFDDIMWFIHSDEVRVLISQILALENTN